MISHPKGKSRSIKKETKQLHELTALEYSPSFFLTSLNPSIGMTFRIWVDQHFISFMYTPVVDRKLYGFIHYSSESDLAAVCMHTGCLFADIKTKESSHRQFLTVTNLHEAMCCSETEYHKRALFYYIPNDVRICGVLVTILICPSPPFYQAANRNGIRSRESSATDFSFRICNSRIFTNYDKLPKIVDIKDYRYDIITHPTFHLSFTGEIGIKYSKIIFDQFISRETFTNGLFEVYRIFVDSKGTRYEIRMNDDGFLSLVKIIEPVSIEQLKRKNGSTNEVENIEGIFDIDEIITGDDYIRFKNSLISDVDTFILMNLPGKMSRSPSLRLNEDRNDK
ncbi:hypothetical protein TRFO_24534 [Tritrichomonas foetus]|uniref:Uncharacterized protein n=1 Tax=Tritrichomonas foetus TaxID=1144522 RepID=A0A1J4K8T3_9EUKA|nr:hypothetical protein TRFO_24534 [Tritrichomonas foetus]|eukprot:OHT07346.1 hypothetical protein TRFO_24534 [Tritrichomonas foetus]